MSDVAALPLARETPRVNQGKRAAQPKPRARLRRPAKLAAAAALIAAGLWAALSGQGYVSSDNAVVSAYTVSVRAPIDGHVSGVLVRVGDAVEPMAVLARLEDTRVNDQRLTDLRQLVARSEAERAAYVAERDELTNLRLSLLKRASDHDATEVEYLSRQADEAASTLAARAVRRDQARRDFARKSSLGRDGWAAMADVDKLRADLDVADLEARAQDARLSMLRTQSAASLRGMFLESGSNDVAYSTQRADEIAIRIADAERAIASFTAATAEARGRLQSEERRVALQREATLVTPSGGMIWKLGVSDGERLSVGEMAAEVVDCRSAFILAAVPQDRFGDVEINGTAKFRLSGETIERTGRVVSVTGDSSVALDRNLAAAPPANRGATAIVRVEVEPSGNASNACVVGRTVRILLPASAESSLFARLARRLF